VDSSESVSESGIGLKASVYVRFFPLTFTLDLEVEVEAVGRELLQDFVDPDCMLVFSGVCMARSGRSAGNLSPSSMLSPNMPICKIKTALKSAYMLNNYFLIHVNTS
jgi:hypothetical protein